MRERTKICFRLTAIILLSVATLTFTSCFPTEHYEPDFNVVSESASQIPSSGLLYEAEFNWEGLPAYELGRHEQRKPQGTVICTPAAVIQGLLPRG